MLSNAKNITLNIYNQTGQLITELVNEYHQAGQYRVLWNGTDAAGSLQTSGIYYARIFGNGLSRTYKMVMMK